jgi:hypothetical protein
MTGGEQSLNRTGTLMIVFCVGIPGSTSQHSKSFLHGLGKSASLTRVPARLSDHQLLIDGALHILTIQPHPVFPEKKPATL